jgi:transposase-like protein
MPRRSKFDPSVKKEALDALQAGTSVADVAIKTGVPATTLSNWKKQLNKKNGGAEKKGRRNMVSLGEELANARVKIMLKGLENKTLRSFVDASEEQRKDITIAYLLKRLKIWGDKDAKTLVAATPVLKRTRRKKA